MDIRDAFFWEYLRLRPDLAIHKGIWLEFPPFPDISERGMETEIVFLEEWYSHFEDKAENVSSSNEAVDYSTALSFIKWRLFMLDRYKLWRKYPLAPQMISEGIVYPSLMDVPPEIKYEIIKKRIAAAAELLVKSRDSLTEPIKEYIEIAMGMVSTMPVLLKRVERDMGSAGFKVDISPILSALKDYYFWLMKVRDDAKPFTPIGETMFSELLQSMGVELSAKQLEDTGRKYMDKSMQEIKNIIEDHYPRSDVEDVIYAIKDDHPESIEMLLNEYRMAIKEAREFVISNRLVQIPEPEKVEIYPMPEHMKKILYHTATITSGRFDTTRKTLYFIAPPKTPKLFREHNRHMIRLSAVHEIYPGHHVQALYERNSPSLIRSLHTFLDYYEGWACYSEHLAFEHGFFSNPESRIFYHLARVWRSARLIGEISLFTGAMNTEEVKNFFVFEGLMDYSVSEGEIRSSMVTPGSKFTYIYGLNEMLKIRDAVKQSVEDFDIMRFHKNILSEGCIPLNILKNAIYEKYNL